MRGSAGNSTAVLCCNTANSSLTIGVKEENMKKRIGSVLPIVIGMKVKCFENPHYILPNR